MSSSEPRKDRFAPLTYEQMYGVEEPEPDGRPLELEIDSLVPFPNQPFNSYTEDEMMKMVESIQENGVISPIIVRPKGDGETYEIISGHNRVEACRRAGICQIPCFIREVDDETAVIRRLAIDIEDGTAVAVTIAEVFAVQVLHVDDLLLRPYSHSIQERDEQVFVHLSTEEPLETEVGVGVDIPFADVVC